MIVPMIKYDFVLYSGQHKEFLDRLQHLGLVDISIGGWEASDAERDLISTIELYRKALTHLKTIENNGSEGFGSAEKAFAKYLEGTKNIELAKIQLAKAEKDADETATWGQFSANAIAELEHNGFSIRFFTAYNKEYDKNYEEWSQKYIVELISTNDNKAFFVVVVPNGEVVAIDAQEVNKPIYTAPEIQKIVSELEAQLEDLQQILNRCVSDYELMEENLNQLQNRLQMSQVITTSKFEADGQLVILEGWATKQTAEDVEKVLKEYPNLVYFTTKPTPKDNAPVLLQNNRFTKPFELIGNFYSLPKYGSMDLTVYFAPFYMLFFGFCMADAGYGLLLLLGGIALLYKGSEDMKSASKLTITCGIATVIFGLMVGSFFGIPLMEQNMFADVKEYFLTPDNLFILAIGIGIVQIILGMILKIVSTTIQFGFKYTLGTLGWLMVIIAGLITMADIDGFGTESIAFKIVVGAGLAMMLLLNTPGRNPILNIGPGLWNTYNDVTGLLGDVLSYIRLFAIGLSGGSLAMVFNQLAVGMSPDIPILGELVTIMILLVGHSINLFMSSLSSFVHPLRLTFVEFYKNAGFESGTRGFNPLKK